MTYVRSRRLGVTVVPYQTPPAVTQVAPVGSGTIVYRPPTQLFVSTEPVTAPGVPPASPPVLNVYVPQGQPLNQPVIPPPGAAAVSAQPAALAPAQGETSTAALPGAGPTDDGVAASAGPGFPWGWIAAGLGVAALAWLATS